MRLTYIFHSGFVIETPSCILIFDYWLDPTGVIPKALSTQKPVYVFASHFHEEHFTKEILKSFGHLYLYSLQGYSEAQKDRKDKC